MALNKYSHYILRRAKARTTHVIVLFNYIVKFNIIHANIFLNVTNANSIWSTPMHVSPSYFLKT